jgi:glycosyltransferase involved in cell wall biosynthesis
VKVSVIMAVYNGEKYLKESIDSIINQTFKNFEFIIINDGSTDGSLKILDSYKDDDRLKVLNNEQNKGLIYSLNRGINEARGIYIARMDADDIAYLNRLEEQVALMDSNKEIAISGGEIKMFFEGIPFVKRRLKVPCAYNEIQVESLFQSTFVHPSIIMRKSVLDKMNLKYEEKYKFAEDYGLWSNIIANNKCINLKKILLNYRVVKQSETRKANKDITQRREVFKLIYNNYFENLGIKRNEKELNIHFEICMIQNLKKFEYSLKEKELYLKNLKEVLYETNLDKEYIEKSISEKMMKVIIYQVGNIKKVKSNLIIDYGILKKLYYLEKIKKVVKSVY